MPNRVNPEGQQQPDNEPEYLSLDAMVDQVLAEEFGPEGLATPGSSADVTAPDTLGAPHARLFEDVTESNRAPAIPTPPAFPLHIFGRQAEFLQRVAEHCQVQVEVPAMQALGVLSAVTQKRCQIVTHAGRSMTGLYIMVSAV